MSKVFIAYHGTNDPNGSAKKAERIFDFLTSYGVDCYFFKKSDDTEYQSTYKKAFQSDLFLLVANSKIREKLNENGVLKDDQYVHGEMNTFANGHVYNKIDGKKKLRVYAFGGFSSSEAERLLPNATDGNIHFDENEFGEEECFKQLLLWCAGKTKEELDEEALINSVKHNYEKLKVTDSSNVSSEEDSDELTGSDYSIRKRRRITRIRRRRIIQKVTIAILIVAVLAAIGWGINSAISVFKAKQAENNVNMIDFELVPSDSMSVEDLNEAEELLRGRLEILCDGENYELSKGKKQRLNLSIPESALRNYDYRFILRCYLTRPIDLFFYNIDAEDYAKTAVEIPRSVIEQTEFMYYEWEEQHGNHKDPYYIKLKLKDAFMDKYESAFDKWGSSLTLAQDINESPSYRFDVEKGAERGVYYIFNKIDNSEDEDLFKFIEMMEYNYSHPAIEYGFTFIVDGNKVADWEDKNDKSLIVPFGKNQCNDYKINENSITASITCDQAFLDGDWYNVKSEIKNRLETLEIPYAVGNYSVNNERSMIFVKTGLKHMSLPLVSLLGETEGLTIRADRSTFFIPFKDSEASVCKYTDNSYGLKVKFLKENEMLRHFTKTLQEQGGGKLYLCYNNYPILCRDISEEIDGDEIDFYYYCSVDNEEKASDIFEENVWLLNYLEEVWSSSSVPYEFEVSIHNNNKNVENEDVDFEIPFVIRKSYYEEAVTSVYKGATIESSSLETLKVSLNLPYDEMMPEMGLEYAKQIYDKINFENSPIKYLYVFIGDQSKEDNEYNQVGFSKGYILYDGSSEYKNGKTEAFGYFQNGRVKKYADEYKKLLEKDSFYKKMTVDSEDWHF